ncbi:hypothetical protein [Halobaculum lipolyticum]|uniref:Uncharacterized protein n=1 Tax=Halobaculum lipolyticum TaxID=3032001 RepID=A0ABD5W9P0_9EURY|nr:hypothetical protein [Halobaculum sp. DT31]
MALSRAGRWAVGGAVGVAVGAANWQLLVANGPLTATLVVLYAAGSALLIRTQAVYRRAATDTDGPDWWAGTAGPLVLAVGVFGLNAGLGLAFDLRTSLLLLVVGAMLATYGLGIASAVSWFAVDADPDPGGRSDAGTSAGVDE